VNLINLQKKLKYLVKGSFEFRNTRNGTGVVTGGMMDYSAIRTFFDDQKYHYFTFHAKSEKPIKAVIRQLTSDTPAEDIASSLQDLGFRLISVKQMISSRPSPKTGANPTNLPLFLITLDRAVKPKYIFKLTNICHVAVKVEAYRAQSGLTQYLTVKNLAISGQTDGSHHDACGAEAITSIRSALKARRRTPPPTAATVS
jgi:hypothetical protein